MKPADSARLPDPTIEVEIVLPDGTRIIRRSTPPRLVYPYPYAPPTWPGAGGSPRDCGCPTEGYVCGSVACPRAVKVWC